METRFLSFLPHLPRSNFLRPKCKGELLESLFIAKLIKSPPGALGVHSLSLNCGFLTLKLCAVLAKVHLKRMLLDYSLFGYWP